jgi:hypothetical protein
MSTCPNCPSCIEIIELIEESDRVPRKKFSGSIFFELHGRSRMPYFLAGTSSNSPFRNPFVFKNRSLPCFYLGFPVSMLCFQK